MSLVGRTVIVEVETATAGTFATLGSLNSKTLQVSTATADATTPDESAPEGILWSKNLDGAKQVSISGDGILEESDAEKLVRGAAFAVDNQIKMKFTVPGIHRVEGTFRVEQFDVTGAVGEAAGFSLSVVSNGACTNTEL